MTQKNERQPRSILEPVIHNERRWELEFIDALRSGQLGVRASALYRGLDAGIGLLTVIASCLLGCKGTDHHLENLR